MQKEHISPIILLSLIVSLTLIGEIRCSSVLVTELENDWNMQILSGHKQSTSLQSTIYNVTIPTVLHLDLLANGDIPDPFINDNWQRLKWVSESNVKYWVKFNVKKETLTKYQNHRMVFEGIDTFGNITLNGKPILSTENAFREYSTLINSLIKQGQNTLQVQIHSTKHFDEEGQKKDAMPFEYAQTRKACYQYSWDWAPYLNTMGIWKRVYIESFEDIQINYVWARNRFISEKKAIINFALDLEIPSNIQGTYIVVVKHQGKDMSKKAITQKHAYLDVQIQKPQLWWPNGIGQPHIYDFQITVQTSTGSIIDTRHIAYGIRTIKLDQTNKQFTIIVNGYPVYSKGANYVPPDMFYPRLTNRKYTPGNTIKQLMEDAVDSNFNMIRLWGGGQYQSDQFFDIASRKGIMIFYDFMFSDSVYPSSEDFLINVQQQLKQQIRRVRNYPCLALWSGNNQILQGIKDWGWSSKKYQDDYKTLFETLIPKIIQIQNPQMSYIASSPVNGVGNYNFDRGGDVHYWGVWAGGSPFESYSTAIGHFNSQFGTQSLPVWETICQTVNQTNRNYDSQVFLSHERHNSKFSTLKKYMSQYMRTSLNFQLQAYQSGLLQGYAIQIAIKAQRCSKPKSQGTLYWQFNDAWPAVSWSAIDYFGRWKPLQYMAKRLYPDVAVFYTNELGLVVVSDKLYPVEARLIVQLITFDGQIINNLTQSITLKPNQVKKIQFDIKKQPLNQASTFLYTEIIGGRKEVMSSTHFFKKFNALELPADSTLQVEYHEQYQELTVSCNKLIKNLFISNSKQYIKTSDNYFDLVPGHKVKVQIKTDTPLKELIPTMVFRSYYQVYNQEPLKVNIIDNKS